MKTYSVFKKNTIYESYDGIETALLGVFEDFNAASARMKSDYESELEAIKEVYGEDEYCVEKYDKYIEVLLGDSGKREFFIVEAELNEPISEDL